MIQIVAALVAGIAVGYLGLLPGFVVARVDMLISGTLGGVLLFAVGVGLGGMDRGSSPVPSNYERESTASASRGGSREFGRCHCRGLSFGARAGTKGGCCGRPALAGTACREFSLPIFIPLGWERWRSWLM